MSMEIGSPQVSKHKTHKKSKDKSKDVEKRNKKRKRAASDDTDLTMPTKKHRSKSNPEHIVAQPEQSQPIAAPIVSPFYLESFSLYLPLPPIAQGHAIQGLCAEFLSPLILTYYPPFHGTIISYNNPRVSTEPEAQTTKPAYARAVDEYAASFVWLTAEYLMFKPRKGTMIEGQVNLQNESNIGLLCWNFFNASIDKKRLAKGWKWIDGGMAPPRKKKLKKAGKSATTDSEDDEETYEGEEGPSVEDTQGYFRDAQNKKVEGLVRFTVRNVETSRSMDRETGFLSIEGTMLSEVEEKELQEQEAIRKPGKGGKQRKYIHDPKDAMTGALTNGYDGAMDVDSTRSLKHRAKY
ncbi:DNA-directed RNA polymerase I subunit RPA43, partial [Lecanoromycetidae sp. Uapishka_2]